ncbi:vWA domain-containing protein [Marixanthomonas spongiae]|uniref:VWFA domain-containing protein n=1 Tax=Marixanthomonas spongiae TaxID=2174845 RepID=A0A2U0I3R0_9FLAO|nr:VWA domain-containing protein [Marixanthomonas spongiae]PVW15729.1 hypothetical protein DDV96_05530 [Marixanthomonas spongiae]
MKLNTLFLFLFALVLSTNAQVEQASETPSPIIFIYDASGSMWGQMEGKTKMEIAATVLSESIGDFSEDQKIGLVAYGHRKKGDCRDVETLLPMSNTSKSSVSSTVKSIKPLGKTPLAYSATTVIDQLRKNKEKATIVLITDGIESCDGNICDVVTKAKKEGIDFKLHIVGFGLKNSETEQLKCAAKAGEGNYYDAADASGLGDAMSEVASQTIDKEEGNFGVYAIKNDQPIDAWVLAYKAGTKEKVNALRTYGETRYMFLPAGKYDLLVRPMSSNVQEITVTNVESFEDKKTERTISFDGGKIASTTTNNGKGWDSTVKIKDKDGKVVAGGRTYGRVKELEVNPGIYTVEFQALAMKGLNTFQKLENVAVAAGEVIELAHNFNTGTFFIDAKVGDKSIDTMVSVKEKNTGKAVDGSRTYDRGAEFLLNPATYTVKVTPLGSYKDRKSQSFTIEVKTGESITKTLNF